MSSKITAAFSELREKNEKALVAFVTAGDPGLEQLPAILSMLIEAGVDLIEIGVPFSDPIADGSTIQASSQRALDRGVTPAQILDLLKEFKSSVPLVLMGYYNTVLRNGLENFAQLSVESGVTGTIISDVIPEEAQDWVNASREAGLDNVFLVAPTSTKERIIQAVAMATGFVYAVSRTGVTGVSSSAKNEGEALVNRIRQHTDLPVCVGFGIDSPDKVKDVCSYADGAVVGSWLVQLLANEWNDGAGREKILQQVKQLKEATR